jgi:hypothetical protein
MGNDIVRSERLLLADSKSNRLSERHSSGSLFSPRKVELSLKKNYRYREIWVY